MKIRTFAAIVLALGGAIVGTSAFAATDDYDRVVFGNTSGIGQLDGTQPTSRLSYFTVPQNDERRSAVDFHGGYRLGASMLPALEPYARLKPWVGTEATGRGTVLNAGGVLVDVPMGSFVFTPSVGTGMYTDSSGKKPSTPIELRSKLEVSYQFDNNSRFSLGYSHTSNLSVSEESQSSTVLSLYYHIPSAWLLGQ